MVLRWAYPRAGVYRLLPRRGASLRNESTAECHPLVKIEALAYTIHANLTVTLRRSAQVCTSTSEHGWSVARRRHLKASAIVLETLDWER